MTLFNMVKEVVVEQLNISSNKAKKIYKNTRLVNDLEFDTLDIVELILTLEEKFNIEIPDRQAEAIATIEDVIKVLENTDAGTRRSVDLGS